MAGDLTLKVTVTADGRALVQTMEGAGKSVGGFAEKAQGAFGRLKASLSSTQAQLGALAATVGAGAALRDILQVAGDFEAAMNGVAAVSGATGEQLEALRAQAKDLGATTQFSASQAADAMKFLAMAGFSAQEMLEAMPSTLQLAAAAQLDMGTAADITSNILSGFRLEVAELGRANDVLTKAFTSANTDLVQLGEAMKYVGPIASSAGASFEEVTAAIGLLGNAGIQGGMAGTGLRRIVGALIELETAGGANKKTLDSYGISLAGLADGSLSLADALDRLAPLADDTGAILSMFGDRGGPAMATLLAAGGDALRELTAELERAGGTAQAIADTQMEGFNGAMKELASASEALKIALGESGLIEAFAGIAKSAAEIVRELGEVDPQVLQLAATAGVLIAAIAPVITILGAAVMAIGALANPIGIAVVAVVGLVAVLVAFREDVAKAVESAQALYEGVSEWLGTRLTAVLESVLSPINGVTNAFRLMWDKVVGNSYVPDMVDAIDVHFGRLDDVMVKPSEDATAAISGAFDQVGRDVAGHIGSMVRSGEVTLAGFADFVDGMVQRILDRMVQLSVVDPLVNALSGFGGSLATSLFGGAAGATAAGPAGFAGSTGTTGPLGLYAKGGVVGGATLFAHPGGMGVMGEAGPEAILPLARLPGGDLGVKAQGGGGGIAVSVPVEVRVVNQGAPLDVAETRETTGADGSRLIEVYVRDQVRRSVARGEVDGPLQQRYGLRPRAR